VCLPGPPFTSACAVKSDLLAYSWRGAVNAKEDRRKVCRSIVEIEMARRVHSQSSPNDICGWPGFAAETTLLLPCAPTQIPNRMLSTLVQGKKPSCHFLLHQTSSRLVCQRSTSVNWKQDRINWRCYVLFFVQINSLTLVKASIQIQTCKWPSCSAPKSSPVRHRMNRPLQTSHYGSAIVHRDTVSKVLTRTNMKNSKHVTTTPHSSISHPKTTKISVTVTARAPLRSQ
jgi:hypothetical protein